ncbi:hypothetical protein P4O66_010011 [Electrophorus voltai]|uniref:LTD domain-containing protein n=1 Tax=Electrophorus voltai TaxID=2609070 RepID=A0AAD9DVL7_9TELE|nr:hypothetical protein P4O66_010011 [Electrophorus voltai]
MLSQQTGLLCVRLAYALATVRACLIISEVNSDNPSLDTREFVELYWLHGGSVPLDGYALVFYNGNGNTAYRVVHLSGYRTDERGFFVVGSAELQPPPAVPLPPNSVQNGPDAIALYGPAWNTVTEGAGLSAVGLLDAIVYTSRKAIGSADDLARVLTPGAIPYLEDDQALINDESIERCWLSGSLYTFQTGIPTPGKANECLSPWPSSLWIERILVAGARPTGMVEVRVFRKMETMTLVVYDTQTDTVRTSMEFQANKRGIISVNISATALSDLDGWALAIFEQQVTDFPQGGPLSEVQPIDAFVWSGRTGVPSANLTESLIPGRKPFRVDSRHYEDDAYVTRCGVAHWTRDPGTFQLQRPGESSRCTWHNTCPYDIAGVNTTETPDLLWFEIAGDFLLSEVNADTPGSAEDQEFVELWHPSGIRTSLNDIWLLLFNGNNGKVYRELELHGYYTDQHGYFLIGSHKVKPHIALPANTIQNGPDAIAIYRSLTPPSSEGTDVPRNGLLDAVVYRARGSDKDSAELIKNLTPGQLPLLEDSAAFPGDESLSRCGPKRFDHNSFRVASPTPMMKNDCPRPAEGLVINEVGGVSGAETSQQGVFVELIGPPLAALQGLVVMLFGSGGVTNAVQLTGAIGADGFYLLGNQSRADQSLPAVDALGAVLLCFEPLGAGVCGRNSEIQDVLVFSEAQSLHPIFHGTMQQHIHPVASFDSFSRCAMKGSAIWATSHTTPRLQNLCPSPSFSSYVDLCLQPERNMHFNCTLEKFADLLELSCNCGVSISHFKGVNLTCLSGRLYVQGQVLAVSNQQRAIVAQALQSTAAHSTHMHSCSTSKELLLNKDSSLGLQVGLVLAVVLLAILGGSIFFYLYKKKYGHPQDYYSMELNENESPMEL